MYTELFPVPLKGVEKLGVALSLCAAPGHHYEIQRGQGGLVMPEALADDPFDPVPIHRPFDVLLRNRQPEAGMVEGTGARQQREPAVGRFRGPLENPVS